MKEEFNEANLKAEPLPQKGSTGFKPRTSASIIAGIAGLSLAVGLIMIIVGLTNGSDGAVSLYVGIGLIVSSAYMFVIYNLATDVQALSYDTNIQLENNNAYQEETIQLLREINEKLDALNRSGDL